MFSAFNPSKCTHLEQWAADCAAPGEQSCTSFRSRDSNPQPWVTSGFKSNALSIRPTTAHANELLILYRFADLHLGRHKCKYFYFYFPEIVCPIYI